MADCSACKRSLPADEFSRSQMRKSDKRCRRCIHPDAAHSEPLQVPSGQQHGGMLLQHPNLSVGACLNGAYGWLVGVDSTVRHAMPPPSDFYISHLLPPLGAVALDHNIMQQTEMLKLNERLQRQLADANSALAYAEEHARELRDKHARDVRALRDEHALQIEYLQRAQALQLQGQSLASIRPSLDEACPCVVEARKFLSTVSIPVHYFDMEHDRCYCSSCYLKKYPDTIDGAGTKYIVPRGWTGFGLALPSRALDIDIFERWSVSFHGTKPHVLRTILQNGTFAVPGDKLLDGSVLGSRNSAGRQDKHFYTSPTVNYAGLQIYAQPVRYRDSMMGQIVLMCRQDETTLKRKQGETVNFRYHGKSDDHMCKYTPLGGDIEWLSDNRTGCIPCRILVRTFSAEAVPDIVRSPVDRRPDKDPRVGQACWL